MKWKWIKSKEDRNEIEKKIVHGLVSGEAAKRLAARHALEENGESEFDLLLKTLTEMSALRKRLYLVFGAFVVRFAVIWFVISALYYIVSGRHISVGGLGGIIGASLLGIFQWIKTRNEATKLIAKHDDIRIVGPMAEALRYGNSDTKKIARESLLNLLPRLRFSDAHLLNDDQRTCLHKVLKSDDDAFILVILKAFEQVGDEKAIPFVKALASARTMWNAPDRRIIHAAEECLLLLQIRAEEGKTHKTLLRPASQPEMPVETLLRPAAGASQTEPQELLRAATGSNENPA